MNNQQASRVGFTLTELLVAVAIIGALVSLLLPAVQTARASARRTQCASNLRQIGLAISLFHDSLEQFPPARIEYRQGDIPSRICGGLEPTWYAYILPFVEEASAADRWDLFEPYSEHDEQARNYAPKIFSCPTRGVNSVSKNEVRNVTLPCGCGGPIGFGPTGAVAHYAGNHGDLSTGFSSDSESFFWGGQGTGLLISVRATCGGYWPPYPMSLYDRVRSRHVTDGLSNTVLVGELHVTEEEVGIVPDNGPMYDGQMLPSSSRLGGPGMRLGQGPNDTSAPTLFNEHSNYGFGSWHAGVCQFVFGDGSVRSLENDIDEKFLGNLCNRSDGQVVSPL